MSQTNLNAAIVDACIEMNACGLNQGTSGNISVRCQDRMLITPSAVPYDTMTPDDIVSMSLADNADCRGPHPPSSEWRFHFDILNARPEINAVVHAHPVYATALAMLGRNIPAAHYMVAAFGGHSVRCAPFAVFGTQALSDFALDALRDRTACLLANHGSITLGETLDKAMWRAVELETLAKQYAIALQIGEPVIVRDQDIDETLAKFAGYGLRDES
jgi:L-fuculose-phosphate aldolase